MNGLALLKEHVAALNRHGLNLDIWDHAGQTYVYVPAISAPMPPWDKKQYEILVAIPGTYGLAALDAFYLGLPYTFNGKEHPRVNGGTIDLRERKWKLVSWHYPDAKPWQLGRDTLSTHVEHCHGFFLHRGAINVY